MKNGSDKLDKQLSRRKFLEHTTTAGSAAVISSAVARAQNAAGAVSSNSSVPSMGTMVEYKSNDLMIPAYLARPTKQNAAAVLIIHEVFGLNDHIKSIADRLAAQGYNALAPNLFVRAPEPPPADATDMARIRKAASSIPDNVAIKDMQAGLDYLKTVKGVMKKFASVGFCMGGGFSYQIATHTHDLAGAVIFYGRTPLDLVPQVSCPLLGFFGAKDTGIPADQVHAFEQALKQAGKKADIYIYPDAKHGFFNDTRPEAYNAQAAADAWDKLLKFYHERL